MEFSGHIFENLIKIRLVEAELFHADGRTDAPTDRQADMTKLIVAFRNFAKAPKNNKGNQLGAYASLTSVANITYQLGIPKTRGKKFLY